MNDQTNKENVSDHTDEEISESSEIYDANKMDDLDKSADDSDSTDDDVEIIYKKEMNPILKLFIGFTVFTVIAVIGLFIAGFTMGLMGINPPTIDNNVITNQWEKATGTGEESEPPSELQKKKPSPQPSDNANESESTSNDNSSSLTGKNDDI